MREYLYKKNQINNGSSTWEKSQEREHKFATAPILNDL